jgi:hypothetical protein
MQTFFFSMIPEEFAKFSKKFEVGFLYWIEDERPTMIRTEFQITTDKVLVEPIESEFLQSPEVSETATLLFANPYYTERCEMGIVKGKLKMHGEDGLEIEAHDITWTFSFDLDEYPERLVRRWKG